MDTLENAQRRAEYWKAEHSAANAEIERLRDLLERAATEADNSCIGWNDALMHEGARKAGDAVRRLLVPNATGKPTAANEPNEG